MIYLQFILGMVLYSAIASLSYYGNFKQSQWYVPLGMFLGLTTSLIWFNISKAEPDPSILIIKGLWWDAMLTLIFIIIPLLFFGARLSMYQWVGFGLVLLGLGMAKLG